MSTLTRRLIILALGLLAGLCAWPVAELVLCFQGCFASYLALPAGPGSRHRGRDGGLLRRRRGNHLAGQEPDPDGMLLGAAVGLRRRGRWASWPGRPPSG